MPLRAIATALIVLLLVVAGTQLLRRPGGTDGAGTADSPLAQDYDYFLSDMVLDRFGPDGTLQYHLTSERVTHFPAPDHSRLDNPSLQWFEPGKPDWLLRARSGDLRQTPDTGATRLLLQQDVVASRTPRDGATLDIRSESLLVLPDSGEASTEQEVRLDNANTHLQAAGMQAWLREDRVRLSAGRGQHE